jgi:hypothetical protein
MRVVYVNLKSNWDADGFLNDDAIAPVRLARFSACLTPAGWFFLFSATRRSLTISVVISSARRQVFRSRGWLMNFVS